MQPEDGGGFEHSLQEDAAGVKDTSHKCAQRWPLFLTFLCVADGHLGAHPVLHFLHIQSQHHVGGGSVQCSQCTGASLLYLCADD